jgi:hypothetical protein
MSLFADGRYQWRETYFVLFDRKDRPKEAAVRKAFDDLKKKVELQSLECDDEGFLESLTILSHADASGMDVTYLDDEEVQEQITEIKRSFRGEKLTAEQQAKLAKISASNARYDVFHFEELGDGFLDEEDEGALDPTTLLAVLARLAKLCHGVSLDPQGGDLG